MPEMLTGYPEKEELPGLTNSQLMYLVSLPDCPTFIVNHAADRDNYVLATAAWMHPNIGGTKLAAKIRSITSTKRQHFSVSAESFAALRNPQVSRKQLLDLEKTSWNGVYTHANYPNQRLSKKYPTLGLTVRRDIARFKPNLTEEMQMVMAVDAAGVQQALADNSCICSRASRRLGDERSPLLLHTLMVNPSVDEELKADILCMCLEEWQNKPSVGDKVWIVGMGVIVGEFCSDEETLMDCCSSQYESVRAAAAGNPACPEEGKVIAALMDR